MKKRLVLAAFLFTALGLNAQVQYDTVKSKPIAPGVHYKQIQSAANKWTVNILKVELKNPNVMLETAKGLNQLKTFKDDVTLVGDKPVEQLSYLALGASYDEHTVVGGINGDFFTEEEGRPLNMQIRKDEILQAFPPDNEYRSTGATIGFDKNNTPMIGQVEYRGYLTITKKLPVRRDSTISLDGINGWRGLNQMWMYNRYNGSEGEGYLPWSGQNPWGPEFVVEPIDAWTVNGNVRAIVRGLSPCCPDTTVRFQPGWAVLSQHRILDDWLISAVSVGDTVTIRLEVAPGVTHPSELLGGSPMIVKNGAKYVEQGYKDEGVTIDPTKPHHSKELHARSAVGLSQDSTWLYMVTVDKNDKATPQSVGMTLDQLSDLMISLGAYNALNLSGGDYTTLYAGSEVVNNPVTGAEVPISNALLVAVKSTEFTGVFDGSTPPSEYTLYQNYPNPFNPSTSVSFFLKSDSRVVLMVYNLLGQKVAVLANGEMSQGIHTLNFDASGLPSGLYFYRMDVRESSGAAFSQTRKMMLLK